MDWSNLTDTLLRVAPTIAGMVGGPIGSMAVQGLESVFGLTPGSGADAKGNPTPALASAILGMTADQAIAMAKIDADLKTKFIDAGISYENIAAGDRNSARAREMSVKDWTPCLLACGVTAGFFGLLGWMVAHEAPAGSRDLLNVMIGTLGTAWVAIIAYYFGSSAGSAKKDDTITALSK
jgi:hypothetical protein